MKSSWASEIRAVVGKEVRAELRNRSATYTAFMLSVVTVFTMAFGFYGRTISPPGAAGMLWAALIFAGVGTLIRAFVSEDEQGTGDLLRMWAQPHAVYWGKALYAFVQMAATSLLITLLFFVLTSVSPSHLGLLVLTLCGGAIGLAGVVTLVSALISRGGNRTTIGSVVAVPLIVPLVALGVTAVRASIDGAFLGKGFETCLGVWGYSVAITAVAPYVFAVIWREQ